MASLRGVSRHVHTKPLHSAVRVVNASRIRARKFQDARLHSQDVGQDEQVCEGLPGQLHSAQVEHSEPTLCANRVPAALGVGTVLASTMIVTGPAYAENAVLDLATTFGEVFLNLQSMGDNAEIPMLLVVTLCEMVPLLPTQPLAIACGLLFGAKMGVPVALGGTVLAATFAFLLSRTFGAQLLARASETVSRTGLKMEGADEIEGSGMQSQITKMKGMVEAGGVAQTALKVGLIRLSPVVPYSVSNYLMGLTEVPFPSFFMGTVFGMAPWMFFYTNVGSTGRSILQNGGDVTSVIAELTEQAEGLLEGPIAVLIAATVVAAIVVLSKSNAEGVEQN
eukprot:CAMPEP_0114253160 /NCGR_PEP_ID=MMETSP0058-20121206/16238_1 /TAXON_ID=36894 /ORGANISM="Pyramimonas parkeae, CCMP726" /LENGTH=336 /DNA_ID=CAMNT_0001367175 /DNA_START=152 /DNA_END=1162 /DNA_ORIENTATION=-